MKFRNNNDKIHYYGSFALSLLSAIGMFMWAINPDAALWYRIVYAYLTGIGITTVLGLLWEALEHWVLPRWDNKEFWKNKPEWLHDHFSGDTWDWEDINLNIKGAMYFPLITIWRK